MAIRSMSEDMDIIAKLDDQPNDMGGFTAEELKGEFDRAGKLIRDYINERLIPDIKAGNIPIEEITGLYSDTVQGAISELYDRMREIVSGIIPPDSLPGEVIIDGSITSGKISGVDGGTY